MISNTGGLVYSTAFSAPRRAARCLKRYGPCFETEIRMLLATPLKLSFAKYKNFSTMENKLSYSTRTTLKPGSGCSSCQRCSPTGKETPSVEAEQERLGALIEIGMSVWFVFFIFLSFTAIKSNLSSKSSPTAHPFPKS